MDRLEQFLMREFLNELESYPRLAQLVQQLDDQRGVYVFGGWCRDKIHSYVHNHRVAFTDIDLVIDGEVDESLFIGLQRTKFGGFRMRLEGHSLVDFWPVKRSFAFSEHLFEPSLENLLRSTVFDVNSVLFDVNAFRLMEGLALRAIRVRRINFNCVSYLRSFADLQAFRALAIARKLGYGLSPDIDAFVANLFQERAFDEFVRNVKKYRRQVSRDAIQDLYNQFLTTPVSERSAVGT